VALEGNGRIINMLVDRHATGLEWNQIPVHGSQKTAKTLRFRHSQTCGSQKMTAERRQL